MFNTFAHAGHDHSTDAPDAHASPVASTHAETAATATDTSFSPVPIYVGGAAIIIVVAVVMFAAYYAGNRKKASQKKK